MLFEDGWEEAQVRSLGERIGFGRVMQLCERVWREKLKPQDQEGGEHTVGPCAAFMVPCICLEKKEDPCDWCCGSGRVTRKVAEAQREGGEDG